MGGRLTFEEVEVVAGRCCNRAGGGDGGLSVKRAHNFCGVIFVSVDVDGAICAPGRGISFGGYEERSYCLTSSSVGGGMIDTRFFTDSSQHRSSIVSSWGGVLSSTSLASMSVSFLSKANLC